MTNYILTTTSAGDNDKGWSFIHRLTKSKQELISFIFNEIQTGCPGWTDENLIELTKLKNDVVEMSEWCPLTGKLIVNMERRAYVMYSRIHDATWKHHEDESSNDSFLITATFTNSDGSYYIRSFLAIQRP